VSAIVATHFVLVVSAAVERLQKRRLCL